MFVGSRAACGTAQVLLLAISLVFVMASASPAQSVDTATLRYQEGRSLLEQGKPEAASDKFREAIALKPNFMEAHLNLGAALLQTGSVLEPYTSFRWPPRLNLGT